MPARCQVALCLFLASGGLAESATAQDVLPRFEPATCPFGEPAWLERERIKCGYLVVPERRDGSSARTLRLAVAVVPSLSESPLPDPIVYVQGGPGLPSLRYIRSMISGAHWSSLRAERGLIFMDQRGTGLSEPEFCVELNDALRDVYYEGLTALERRRRVRAAMAACRGRMLAAGVDPTSYGSAQAARDLADLRVALGYHKWNLYGVSYGTRLALVTMRDAPQGIRSVVLSSVIPPNAPERPLSNFQRALDAVFARCAAEQACAAEYPDLEGRFYRMLDSLQAKPLEVVVNDTATFPGGVVVIDGDLAAAAVFQALYSPAVIRYLPLIVRVLETRRDDVLEPLMGSISGAQASSRGLFLSVECYERAPYLAEEAVTEDATNAPGLAAHGTLIRPYLGDCGAWLAERASPAELDAVRSDIPTLVLSGSLDPITPPAWGKLAASTLANSFFVEARTGSHGSSTDECSRSIIRDFLYSPSVAPNTACNDRRPPLRFATGVRLNGGIYRTATALRRAPTGSAIWWIGATVVVLLSSAMTWPLSLLARRRRQREPPWAHAAITARWLALLAMVAAIGFLAGLVGIALRTVRTAPLTLAFGVPDAAAPLFVLPWAVAIIGAVLMMLTAAAWIQKAWTRAARIHYMLIALACLSLVAFLAHYRLI